MPRRPKKKPGANVRIPGQQADISIGGSKTRIKRQQDEFIIKRPPKKPKITWTK